MFRGTGRGMVGAGLRGALGGMLGAAVTLLVAAGPAGADTVADIRAELTLLQGQIEEIRGALVASGPAQGLPRDPATALVRLDQLEAELRRLTNRVDVLVNDLERIIGEASNRAADIEFRLTELEGGDVSLLGQPEPLGGGLSQPTIPPPPSAAPAAGAGGAQLAVGEQADFDAARAAFEGGDHGRAAELFAAFVTTYPAGPLTSEAQFLRGEALAAQSDWRGAARSYLDAFSGAPEAPTAPRALLRLAVSLGRLGQGEEACLTLAADVARERQALACP